LDAKLCSRPRRPRILRKDYFQSDDGDIGDYQCEQTVLKIAFFAKKPKLKFQLALHSYYIASVMKRASDIG